MQNTKAESGSRENFPMPLGLLYLTNLPVSWHHAPIFHTDFKLFYCINFPMFKLSGDVMGTSQLNAGHVHSTTDNVIRMRRLQTTTYYLPPWKIHRILATELVKLTFEMYKTKRSSILWSSCLNATSLTDCFLLLNLVAFEPGPRKHD